jgi:ankyrin repeat protein
MLRVLTMVQDIVHLLLNAKADVNACASLPDDDDAFYDQPPLSFACENAHPDVVEALLANSADVNRRSTENRSPLELAAGSENAADEALVEVVIKLVAAGASLESIDEEETPLIRAAMAGHALVTRELLEAGSNPNWSRASNGETALYVACSEGHAAVVEELAQHGSSVDVRKTTTSETALYIACSKGHLEVVKALLKSSVKTDDEQNTVPRTGECSVHYPVAAPSYTS